jgi:hypothetical protein
VKKVLVVGEGPLTFALAESKEIPFDRIVVPSAGLALRFLSQSRDIALAVYAADHPSSFELTKPTGDATALFVKGAIRIAEVIPTIYISTARVFSGPGPHKEWDTPAPLSPIYEARAAGEREVRMRGGCVVRVGMVAGSPWWPMLDEALIDDRPLRVPNYRISVSYVPFVISDLAHIMENWGSYIARVVHSVCWPGLTLPEAYDTVRRVFRRHEAVIVEPPPDEKQTGIPVDSRISNTFLPKSRHVLDAFIHLRDTMETIK